jgi:hypothetical protein
LAGADQEHRRAAIVSLPPRRRPVAEIGVTMSKLDEADRDAIGGSEFAFPDQRKEPIENASHVRAAVARFNQVKGVSDDERDAASARILKAAMKFDIEVSEKSWRDIGK